MSLLIMPKNVATLSEAEIDVDKVWQGFGITDLRELVRGEAVDYDYLLEAM
jgi:hypothetical protein